MVTQDAHNSSLDSYNILFRTTSDGVIVVDGNGIVSRINPAGAGMLRCTPEQVLGLQANRAFHDYTGLVDLIFGPVPRVHRIIIPGRRISLGMAEPADQGP